MTEEQSSAAAEVVKGVARYYKVKCWWADSEEMEQEGWLAVCQALRPRDDGKGYKPERGPLKGYLWNACAFAVRDWLWRVQGPMTIRNDADRRGEDVCSEELYDHLQSALPDPEASLRTAQRGAEVVEYLQAALGRCPDAELAIPILLGEEKHSDVARRLGTTVPKVSAAVRATRAVLEADPDLAWLRAES